MKGEGLTLTTKEQSRLWVMNRVVGREWGVAEAAEVLGVSERHTWRLLAVYKEEGAAALAHGNRGHLPSNATPAGIQAQVIALARERYLGLNHTHFTELLAEREGIRLSRSTVRRLLTGAGLPSSRHRSPPCHRYRRQRMPQEGMLLQIDGSRHRWFGGDGPWLTLILAVDDATGTVPYALFREKEDTVGYFLLMKGIIERRGIPLALYSDRHFIFCHSKPTDHGEHTVIDRDNPSQFGRAMRELGVTQVFARSPEAKGRIERANGTFQDRLVAELRLAGVTTLEQANRFLESFLPRYNERFGVSPAHPETAYRSVDSAMDVDGVLCFKERRRVAKDNTVQYHGHTLQIFPGEGRRSYARVYAEVQERLDGQTLVYYQGKILTPQEAPPLATSLRAQASVKPEAAPPIMPECSEPEEPASDTGMPELVRRAIWYEDSEMMRAHRDLIKAGMEKARQQGKRIGRPRVIERPDFVQCLAAAKEKLTLGLLSRRKAAKELAIGYATLKRLLDAEAESANPGAPQSITTNADSRCNELTLVVD
jgi:transposase